MSISLAFLFWFMSPLSLQLGDKLIALVLVIAGFFLPRPMLFIYIFFSIFKSHFIYSGVTTDPVIYILFPIFFRTIFDILSDKKIKKHISRKEILWFVLFFLIIVINIYRVTSYSWNAYSFQKIITFLIMDFSILFIICLSINNFKIFDKYLRSLLIVLITIPFFNLLSITFGGTEYPWYFVAKGIPVLAISFYLGILAIFSLSMWQTKTNKRMSIILFVLSLVLILTTNERSPLISLLFTIFIIFCYDLFVKKRTLKFHFYRKHLGIITLLSIAVILTLSFFPPVTYSRYFKYSDQSIYKRISLAKTGLSIFMHSPIIGSGPNSVGIVISGNDSDISPHNVFIEILSDFGILGLVPFVAIIIIVLRKSWTCYNTNRSNWRTIFLFYATIYTLVQMCLSSQLNGHRWYWCLFGLVFVEYSLLTKQKHPSLKQDNII